jgi:hypothetical protein
VLCHSALSLATRPHDDQRTLHAHGGWLSSTLVCLLIMLPLLLLLLLLLFDRSFDLRPCQAARRPGHPGVGLWMGQSDAVHGSGVQKQHHHRCQQ